MYTRFLLLIIFILCQRIDAQHKKSYIFFEVDPSIEVKFFSKKNRKSKEVEPIESNLFMFNNQNPFWVEFDTKLIEIDLRRYKVDVFFNVKLEVNKESKGVVYKYKRGDVIRIDDRCKSEQCNVLTVEFPQIISLENGYYTTINDVFTKYILDETIYYNK
ncbi:hypothetical protein HX004_14250 [Myroides sp. 1354]|uniref:hypothetical protein n=1 Tax=unclassified Myroides TaxID=2642485 RepID=UPI0025791746|nr:MULTISPECIES: hypothetical protein [unclassified Myroides]MDM1045916.1 hypothetical protein [Myroides sp. R163-1]MDM1056926.1 hypothetical protein [Myroides sp. 1354]MDM1070121.1 hypothetical protein [Myroides sp. 1372]